MVIVFGQISLSIPSVQSTNQVQTAGIAEAAVTKTRTGLGLDWRWTGDGLGHFSFLTHLNIQQLFSDF